MTPERWRQIEDLYHTAHERASAERPAFLNQQCGSDSDLRRDVESLLAEDSSLDILDEHVFSVTAHSDQLRVGSRLGAYTIEGPATKGGMGEVYKARDQRLNRIVAIKVSRSGFTRRFAREAEMVAQLNHPNVCTLHDVGPNYSLWSTWRASRCRAPWL